MLMSKPLGWFYAYHAGYDDFLSINWRDSAGPAMDSLKKAYDKVRTVLSESFVGRILFHGQSSV